MRLLLADSDRDMLSAYRRLLQLSGHTAATAFDGVQVLQLLDAASFDLAIVNERLPRIAHERILDGLRGRGIPVVVLLNGPLHSNRLCGAGWANAYLNFPFFPSELSAVVEDVSGKARDGATVDCMGIGVDVRGFRFAGTDIRLTAVEMDTLRALSGQDTPIPFEKRVYVHALNRKLQLLNAPRIRIEYLEEKGYRLVKEA